jgi:hypothetical protein
MGGWGDLSCPEMLRKIIMIITFTILAIIFFFNCYIIYRADTDTWFTRCNECQRQGGKEPCDKCCQDCNKADEVFFYVNRAYTMAFTLVAMVSEIKPEQLIKWFKICGFYFSRGMLIVFIGLLCVQSSLADPSGEIYADILGWSMIFVGLFNFFMGFCCPSDMGDEDKEGGNPDRGSAYQERGSAARQDNKTGSGQGAI